MRVDVIPNIQLQNQGRVRPGDILNTVISEATTRRFEFAVAYMRLSGWSRLAPSIGKLLGRGGDVAGIVGIDQGITTVDALEALHNVSPKSTIFHSVSGFIFHPKLYLATADEKATVIIGSPNLTVKSRRF